jgi:hypothetical protein
MYFLTFSLHHGHPVVLYITRHLPVTISTTIYYVLSDAFHSCMFWLLGGHLQPIKIHESKIMEVTEQWFVLMCTSARFSVVISDIVLWTAAVVATYPPWHHVHG